MIHLGYQIKPTKKPILGLKRIRDVLAVCNAVLRARVVEGSVNQAFIAQDGGFVLMVKRGSATAESEVVTITGPATVYEEDGTTIHATVEADQIYTLAISYREVTDTINGNCEFKRKVKCSLPYILE